MQVSVETLKGLERKVTVSVPTEKVEEEVSLRLKSLARKAKVDGFRPGKVPLHVIKKRYSDSVLQEVARDMVQSTLLDALKDNELVPAGYPSVEPEQIESGKDFRYTATFEVFPEISVSELNKAEVEVVKAAITDKDVTNMIEKLREQNKEWQEVSRAVEKGDKTAVDFEGFIDEKAFEGGAASDFEIIVGSGSMIEGFEDGLVGGIIGEPFDIKVTFSKDYAQNDLAGKDATFKITVKKIMEGNLPKLNDEFASKFNITEGGMDALKEDIKQNMMRELERRVSSINREAVFDKLMEKNTFELPSALIDQEIEHLKHEMFHRLFGSKHHEKEKIPDFPRVLFEEQARRSVHLGLLFSEYVKKHELMVPKERVTAMIEKLATAYENPHELRTWYQSSKEHMGDIEALVMEEMVSEKILEDAKIVEKFMQYDEVMNPKKDEPKKEKEKKGA